MLCFVPITIVLFLLGCVSPPETVPPPVRRPTPPEPPTLSPATPTEREYPGGELPEREPLPDYAEVPLLPIVWELNLRDRVDEALSYDRGTNTLFVGTRRGVVLSIAGGDGRVRWSHDAVGEVSSAPTFDDSRVYVGFQEPGGAIGIDRRTGRQLWRTVAVGWVARDPVVRGGRVFFLSAGRLLSITTATGERAGLYNPAVPRNADLGNLQGLGDGTIASFSRDPSRGDAGGNGNGVARGGLLRISNPRRPAFELLELSHSVVRARIPADNRIAVHGYPASRAGGILSIVDTARFRVHTAVPLHPSARLMGAAQNTVYVSAVPPAIIALSANSLSTLWRTRRIHAGNSAVDWPDDRGVAVSGNGTEGVVLYDRRTGVINAHFVLPDGLQVRQLVAGRQYLYLLVSTGEGSRARILALTTPYSGTSRP